LRIGPAGPIVALHSAPEKGRANRELIEFVAEVLGVSPAAVSIIKGHGARRKVVRVETSSPQTMAEKLLELTKGA